MLKSTWQYSSLLIGVFLDLLGPGVLRSHNRVGLPRSSLPIREYSAVNAHVERVYDPLNPRKQLVLPLSLSQN